MNYFAHALPFLDDPYFAAGTCVPDWLSVIDRRLRVREKHAEPFLRDGDPRVVAIAGGIGQHIRDDRRFHQSRAFAEVSLQLTVLARDALGGETSFRPSFLGHLLLEVLLDASLAAEKADRLRAYYLLLESVDAAEVAAVVGRMTSRSAAKLVPLISGFRRERILWEYLEDAKLLGRLNQVMRRVRLDRLPEAFRDVLSEARRLVSCRRAELLDRIPVEPEGPAQSEGSVNTRA